MQEAILVCGPTASGKTLFAHEFAKKYNGEIVNADSMQIYKQIPIITASPSIKLKEELPYHLYNFQDVDQEFSSTKYVELAKTTILEIIEKGKLPIIVGGTGMYINMLIYGYNYMPEIKDEIRNKARILHKELGSKKFFEKLKDIDPKIIPILNIGDTQRVIRAFEVALQTEKSILDFQQKDKIIPLPGLKFKTLFLLPERNFLYNLCNKRLAELFKNGAIEEIKFVYEKYGTLKTSAMKSLGTIEIISYLKGQISKQVAIELASAKTRQYSKRQCTWFNNQIKEKQVLKFSSELEYSNLLKNIESVIET